MKGYKIGPRPMNQKTTLNFKENFNVNFPANFDLSLIKSVLQKVQIVSHTRDNRFFCELYCPPSQSGFSKLF